ncbi:uncharacterized protein LOC132643763 [Lycium barbarum]|uniref:uncharacterized protein LOC132643763 n=1 Tax=Lycium barbarum TaxID=112863 RepID=UPI00293E6AE6|nr:uncharacterized protein LOC132643763 [Lycium barbarum]
MENLDYLGPKEVYSNLWIAYSGDQKSSWTKLKAMHNNIHDPWLVMGDFNAIMRVEDRIIGSEVQEYEVKDFRDFMLDTGMHELQTIGREYTWTNNHIYSIIDRALANATWMTSMNALNVQILEPGFSDHSPVCIRFNGQGSSGGKPFRFFNCMEEHVLFASTVEEY